MGAKNHANHGRDHLPNGSDPIPFGVGDYVFIEEQIAVSNGDPIAFTGIPQVYRHLCVELLGAASDSGDAENHLRVYWNGGISLSYGYAGWWVWDSTSGEMPSAKVDAANYVRAEYVLPDGDVTGTKYGSVTMKFPYYSLDGTQKQVMWQSVGEDYISPDRGVLATYGGGVKNMADDDNAITDLTFKASSYDWFAGSRASLYGIR
jgi:hypothetical protein